MCARICSTQTSLVILEKGEVNTKCVCMERILVLLGCVLSYILIFEIYCCNVNGKKVLTNRLQSSPLRDTKKEQNEKRECLKSFRMLCSFDFKLQLRF